ncbi:gluconate kinase [Collimonas arenae]|uniref:Gluconate kinase n=1 Tax=Collimonas arenae TaxID=279058 RepID=A0A127PWZ2_9BURK|nr:gluconokinase [Collimonas arenae]AMP02360.1 gluconate kinase [Collimonas arenae]AMP12255.1 gluconate kinase [Collimonas arenae]
MHHQPEYMLGVDIGTTSTKAVLFTTQGKVVAQHAVEYPLMCTSPGMAEQDPLLIYAAVLEAIRQAVSSSKAAAEQIALVSFSAAMHSVIAVDSEGNLLSNSITWADNRAGEWANRIRDKMDGRAIYLRTGTPIHPMSPLCKIMWLRHDQPDMFARTARFVGMKEYVFYRLFGSWLVDHSIASATGLFNLQQLDWDCGALELLGIGANQLSQLVPTTHHLSGLEPAVAQQLGLLPTTPFVIGANDGVLSNLGVNAIGPGQVAVTIGTSGAMRTVIDKPLTDPSGRTFCYALTDKHWVVGGPTNNGGSIFRWVRDELATAEAAAARDAGLDPYEALTSIAETVVAGCEGLLFHPYLAGERAPLWNADARGSFFGLAMHHRKQHMIRAALEGVIFSLYSILPAVEDLIGPTQRMMATGGFARSALWRQMMADIFNREVVVPESVESSCLGATVLGLYALGKIDSLEVIADMVGATHRHVPNPDNVALYARLWPIYSAIPQLLEQQYRQLSLFQRETAA